MTYEFYAQQRIRKGDVLVIPFGGPPSRFEVLKTQKRKKFLEVRVLQDNFSCDSEPAWKPDEVVNIGREIYEGFWAFDKEY